VLVALRSCDRPGRKLECKSRLCSLFFPPYFPTDSSLPKSDYNQRPNAIMLLATINNTMFLLQTASPGSLQGCRLHASSSNWTQLMHAIMSLSYIMLLVFQVNTVSDYRNFTNFPSAQSLSHRSLQYYTVLKRYYML
jgi:hypothetical protein